jgi:hypothetical protein
VPWNRPTRAAWTRFTPAASCRPDTAQRCTTGCAATTGPRARYESDDETPWLPEMEPPGRDRETSVRGEEIEIKYAVVGPIGQATADGPPPAFVDRECGVCWASHSCGLPPRHDGDPRLHRRARRRRAARDLSPRRPRPRAGRRVGLYSLDLLRFDDFCDLCGPIPPVTEHIHGILDHAMRTHPDRWVEDGYAEDYSSYLGDGQWQDRSFPPVETGDPNP